MRVVSSCRLICSCSEWVVEVVSGVKCISSKLIGQFTAVWSLVSSFVTRYVATLITIYSHDIYIYIAIYNHDMAM